MTRRRPSGAAAHFAYQTGVVTEAGGPGFPKLRTGSDFSYHVFMAHQHSTRFLDIVKDAKKRVREVTVDDVKQKLDRNDDFLLVDVREDNEWQTDHLPRAIHLGKGVIERDIEGRVPDPNAPIILYCGGGFRSALAADNLGRMGYTNVLSMDGGVREWREKGYPLTKD
jgi:rhodanese-related sulfurtransferase